ncbi:All-trans retinoic acid-induced differentiation factor [Echinococcus granulosus]|nr:All-trans retinoic acid-induced differentiation factor [Echinococcus granulosus]CDS23882.1 apoptosis protein 3 [Echinococcus granulosus]
MYLLLLLLSCPVFSSSLFEEDCFQYGGRVIGRKCALNNEVIGLDLSNSDLIQPPPEISSNTLLFLHLYGNPKLRPLESLCECVALDRLLIDANISSPGGHFSWNSTETMRNSTIRVWEHQLDFCQTFGKDHICPANSECIFNGPGCFNCMCNANHWGYRCLQRGIFPTATFIIGTALGVIFLCVLLLFYRFSARWTVVYQALPSGEA